LFTKYKISITLSKMICRNFLKFAFVAFLFVAVINALTELSVKSVQEKRPSEEPQDMSLRQDIERRYEPVRVKRTIGCYWDTGVVPGCLPISGHGSSKIRGWGFDGPRSSEEPTDLENPETQRGFRGRINDLELPETQRGFRGRINDLELPETQRRFAGFRSSEEPQDMERKLHGHGGFLGGRPPRVHGRKTSGCGKPRSSEEPNALDNPETQIGFRDHGCPRSSEEPQDMERTSGHGSAIPRDEPQDMERNPKIFGRQGGFFGGRKTSGVGKLNCNDPNSNPNDDPYHQCN